MLKVTSANSDTQAGTVDTVVLAFAADPVARWCWPESRQYLASMPSFTLAFAGGAFVRGSAYRTEDGAGAALWLPPDVHPDQDTLGQIVEETVSPSTRDDLMSMMEQMGRSHPEEPHWYLPLIGVDPAHQGKGYGTALMAHALERCDREGRVAYLESTNPRNISLYLRHGFKAVAQIQVGTSPTVVPMVRYPR